MIATSMVIYKHFLVRSRTQAGTSTIDTITCKNKTFNLYIIRQLKIKYIIQSQTFPFFMLQYVNWLLSINSDTFTLLATLKKQNIVCLQYIIDCIDLNCNLHVDDFLAQPFLIIQKIDISFRVSIEILKDQYLNLSYKHWGANRQ